MDEKDKLGDADSSELIGKNDGVSETAKHKASLPKRLWQLLRSKKKLSIPGAVIVVLGVLWLVPATRFGAFGLLMKKDVLLYTIDSTSKEGVANTKITIDGKKPVCGNDKSSYPTCFAKIPVGTHKLRIEANYYKTVETTLTVGLGKTKTKNVEVPLEATGRVVGLKVTNKINGKLLKGLRIKAGGSEGITSDQGSGSVVVDPKLTSVELEVSGDGYNTTKMTVTVKASGANNSQLAIVPAGKLYFLSKLGGKIDVVRTNLDGSARATILPGTGLENDTDTILLASRDWKYLALKSKREGKNPKVYIISTADDKLVAADEGDADFTLYGWSNNHLVYLVNRNVSGQADKYKLKSYDANSGKITLLDKTAYEAPNDQHPYGSLEENFGNVFLVDDGLYYFKTWTNYYYYWDQVPAGNDNQVIYIKPDGSAKKVLAKLSSTRMSNYVTAFLSEPHTFYMNGYDLQQGTNRYFEWEIGAPGPKEITNDEADVQKFTQPYATYLVSPSAKETFWTESRDGKPQFFVGDQNAKSDKNIGAHVDGNTYGWFTDDYLLISKKGSELYIVGRDGGELTKVTDYHKPAYDYRGYGGGYGGF